MRIILPDISLINPSEEDKYLYYKLYSGVRTSDRLLTGLVHPFITKLFSESLINQWFYIRYSDPENHIRLRMMYENYSDLLKISEYFEQLSSPFLKYNQLWSVKLDNYSPEIDRYGKNCITSAEMLFFHDSELAINFIKYNEYSYSSDNLWMFAIFSINKFLEDFGYDLNSKSEIIEVMFSTFNAEFLPDRLLRKQIAVKYSKYSDLILKMIESPLKCKYPGKEGLRLVKIRSESQKELILSIRNSIGKGNQGISLNDIISDFIHMMMNRLFRSEQRKHEFVIYNFLSRYYRSKLARIKYN